MSAGCSAPIIVFPHFAKRIDAFLNPDGGGNTYQVDKALNSLLEGGWFGRGPGESLAKKVIPDAHADYVFSAAAGEFGILFCLCLVALIVFIVLRALSGAQQQPTLYARLAVSTLAIQFGLQCAINLAVNLNLIPPKGMTLPFVSLWRHLDHRHRLRHGADAGPDAQAARGAHGDRACRPIAAAPRSFPPNEHLRADGRRHGRASLSGHGAGAGVAPARSRHPPDDRPSRRRAMASSFPAREIHVVPSATPSVRNPLKFVAAGAQDRLGHRRGARQSCAGIRPDVVVGFGGYPVFPPFLAARLRGHCRHPARAERGDGPRQPRARPLSPTASR